MPKLPAPDRAESLADLIVAYAQNRNLLPKAGAAVFPLSRTLLTAQLHSYDEKATRLVDAAQKIKREDFLKRLDFVSLPFQQLWMAGPNIFLHSKASRMGFLVTELPPIEASMPTAPGEKGTRGRGQGFSFRYVVETEVETPSPPPGPVSKLFKKAADFMFAHHNKMPSHYDLEIFVTPDKGIFIDEEKFQKHLADSQKLAGKHGLKLNEEQAMMEYGLAAEFLLRFFVLLNGSRVGNNFMTDGEPEQPSAEELARREKNKERMRMGRAPELPIKPIVTDLSQLDPQLLVEKKTRKLVDLLGTTRVKQSIWFWKKNSLQPMRYPSHIRHIPSPVNRENVLREFTSTAENPDNVIGSLVDRPVAQPKNDPTKKNGPKNE